MKETSGGRISTREGCYNRGGMKRQTGIRDTCRAGRRESSFGKGSPLKMNMREGRLVVGETKELQTGEGGITFKGHYYCHQKTGGKKEIFFSR